MKTESYEHAAALVGGLTEVELLDLQNYEADMAAMPIPHLTGEDLDAMEREERAYRNLHAICPREDDFLDGGWDIMEI